MSSSALQDLYRNHVRTVADRIRAALDAHGFDAVVLHAGRIQRKSPFDDADWPFRPVPMFTYVSPLTWPDSAVVVDRDGVKLWALRATDFWEKPAEPDWALIRAGLAVEEVHELTSVKKGLPPGKVAFVGHESEAASTLGVSDVNPPALIEALEDGRVAKTPYEVEIMARASVAGARGHRAAEAAFVDGVRSELAIHLAYLVASQQDDADAPYKGIVALGTAAATLHHNVYQDRPGAGSLLIDAGAQHNGYPCDITRTYVEAGDSPGHAAFRALIAGMDALQRDIIGRIEVGMNYEALHDQCHAQLGRLMAEQGLVTCTPEAAVEQGITRAFFPHGLGHSIGVQVHDVACRKRDPKPSNPFLRHTADITAGQVFTIEPGIYFIESLMNDLRGQSAGVDVAWPIVEQLAPFGGIRIEDDVHIREDGSVRNLTREAFAAL